MKKTFFYLTDFNSWFQTCNLVKIELTAAEKKTFTKAHPYTTLYKKEIDAYMAKLAYEQN